MQCLSYFHAPAVGECCVIASFPENCKSQFRLRLPLLPVDGGASENKMTSPLDGMRCHSLSIAKVKVFPSIVKSFFQVMLADGVDFVDQDLST